MDPSLYIKKILQSDSTTLPFIIDELGIIDLVTQYSGVSLASIDECITGNIPGVSLYQKEEDKKHLSVDDIRNWLSDISEIPYEKKHIYILRDFDEATREAMNTTLKILEEPPEYAIIALVVKNPESLLETIHSRTLNLFRGFSDTPLSEKLQSALEKYQSGNTLELIQYILLEKVERDEAISLLMKISKNANSALLKNIEEALFALFSINETPRNILDRVILFPGSEFRK